MPLSAAAALDQHLRDATIDPYRQVPRAVFLAATSDDPALYRGHAGWARLPAHEVSPEELAKAKEGTPIEEDSRFELFSCTKLCGSIAALQLVEQGRVDLHGEARQYVPEIGDLKVLKGFGEDGEPELEEQERPVTVQQLLTHTSGFIYSTWHEYGPQLEKHLGHAVAPYGKDATRDCLYRVPLFHQPGSSFHYGTSIDWLTRIVEEVSGLDLATYFQKHIFDPLDIHDLSFFDDDAQIDLADAPTSSSSTGPAVPTDSPAPTVPYTFRRPTPYSATLRYGGSGLKGSAPSYLRILRALLHGGALDDSASTSTSSRILKPETVDLMFTPQLTAAQRETYQRDQWAGGEPFSRRAGKALEDADWGLGGALTGTGLASGRSARSLHWSGMANTFWVIDREKDVAFVFFSNLLPYGNQAIFDLWEKLETDLYQGLADVQT
ncbi:hypothetical protein JCM9279_000450 [Rhodotorula babjevae]